MRARIAWIACLAILFNAFAPLVSHAMQAAAPAPLPMSVEICTALGMRTMPLALAPGAQDGAAGTPHKAAPHCGFCLFHAAAHVLPPPAPALGFALAAGREAWPPLYYHAPLPLFPWSLAQSRAPPRA